MEKQNGSPVQPPPAMLGAISISTAGGQGAGKETGMPQQLGTSLSPRSLTPSEGCVIKKRGVNGTNSDMDQVPMPAPASSGFSGPNLRAEQPWPELAIPSVCVGGGGGGCRAGGGVLTAPVILPLRCDPGPVRA